MLKFSPSPYLKDKPNIQMTSMIDIMFINLLFFMALFVYFHFEGDLNISVPKAATTSDPRAISEEIVVNITKDGQVVVNQKKMDIPALLDVLKKTAALNPSQSVVLRADQKTYHEQVVRVLDVCAKAKVWNISFATIKER